jgi:hypothetical protein
LGYKKEVQLLLDSNKDFSSINEVILVHGSKLWDVRGMIRGAQKDLGGKVREIPIRHKVFQQPSASTLNKSTATPTLTRIPDILRCRVPSTCDLISLNTKEGLAFPEARKLEAVGDYYHNTLSFHSQRPLKAFSDVFSDDSDLYSGVPWSPVDYEGLVWQDIERLQATVPLGSIDHPAAKTINGLFRNLARNFGRVGFVPLIEWNASSSKTPDAIG